MGYFKSDYSSLVQLVERLKLLVLIFASPAQQPPFQAVASQQPPFQVVFTLQLWPLALASIALLTPASIAPPISIFPPLIFFVPLTFIAPISFAPPQFFAIPLVSATLLPFVVPLLTVSFVLFQLLPIHL